MRKITSKERANGMRNCQWCKPTKVKAIWRSTGRQLLNPPGKIQLACDYHRTNVDDGPKQPLRTAKEEGESTTLADELTWMNL